MVSASAEDGLTKSTLSLEVNINLSASNLDSLPVVFVKLKVDQKITIL